MAGERDDERRELEAAGWDRRSVKVRACGRTLRTAYCTLRVRPWPSSGRARTRRGQNRESRTDGREVGSDPTGESSSETEEYDFEFES